VQPGLHYHLPYPIEQVVTPKVTRLNRVDIGMRLAGDTRRVAVGQVVPEEGLMLTGDENIIDVNFTVLWRVSPTPSGTTDYLFNVRNQEGTVTAVAESAMREVIGRSLLQPILTEGRQIAEGEVQELMQATLDNYGAGKRPTRSAWSSMHLHGIAFTTPSSSTRPSIRSRAPIHVYRH